MAGEIEKPFRLEFRVDSPHSGSISFGRFESEALCWERRSSFSHNRYLEEVEKCSKPGSVTEKKAYFEAHFRKKGFPVPSSPESQNETDYQTSENDTSGKMCDEKEVDRVNASNRLVQFDGSLVGLVHGEHHKVKDCQSEEHGTSFPEPQFEHAGDSTSNAGCIPEHGKVDKVDDAEFGSSLSVSSESEVETKEILEGETTGLLNLALGLSHENYANEKSSNLSPKYQQSSIPKENIRSKSEHTEPRLIPQVNVGQSKKHTSGSTCKGPENKAYKQCRNIPVRFKAGKKTSEDPNKCIMHKTTKYEVLSVSLQRGSETQGFDEINRVKPAAGANKPVSRRDTSRSNFKSNEPAQRRKEFNTKLESEMHAKEPELHQLQSKAQEKTQAEIKQVRESLSFRTMPPFYSGASRVPEENRATAINGQPQKHAKSSIPVIKLSGSSPLRAKARKDQATLTSVRTKKAGPPEASRVTSCHSACRGASSSAQTTKDKPSRAGISPMSRNKGPEMEKLTRIHKHKVPEGNRINQEKTSKGIQKMRIGRATHVSVNGSSRAGHIPVGVAS